MADHDQEIADLEKQVADIEGMLAKLGGGGGPGPQADDAGVTGAGKHNKKKVPRVSLHDQQVGKRKKAAASDAEDAADQGDDEDMEKAKKKPPADDGDGADMEDDYSEPANSTTKKREDESMVIEGQTIQKSVVGDAQYAIMKAQADRIAKTEERLAKAELEKEMAELKKRADDEYPHIPGSTEQRAAMLKVISHLPEDVKSSFEKVLGQAEKLAKVAFSPMGHNGGSDPLGEFMKSKQTFETKVSEIRKRDNCSHTEAMEKARKEDPEAFKAYQGAN